MTSNCPIRRMHTLVVVPRRPLAPRRVQEKRPHMLGDTSVNIRIAGAIQPALSGAGRRPRPRGFVPPPHPGIVCHLHNHLARFTVHHVTREYVRMVQRASDLRAESKAVISQWTHGNNVKKNPCISSCRRMAHAWLNLLRVMYRRNVLNGVDGLNEFNVVQMNEFNVVTVERVDQVLLWYLDDSATECNLYH